MSTDMAAIIQEVIDREGWTPGQVFLDSGNEDYLALDNGAPTVYVHLPGQVILKMKDLTDVVS